MSRAEDRRDMGAGRYSFPQLDAVMQHGTAPGGDVDLPHRAYWAAAGSAGAPPMLEPCFSALPPPPSDEVRQCASRGWWPCVQVPPHDEPLPSSSSSSACHGAESVPPWLLSGSGTSLPLPVPRGDVDMDDYDEDLAHRGWWLDADSPVGGSGSGDDSEGACARLLQRFEHLDMGLVFEIMAECNYDAEVATVMLDEVLTQMQQYEADAKLAQELQREYRGAQHLHDDEELAKRLQHELSAMPHYDGDVALAKQLQAELGMPMDAARLSADEALARKLQRELQAEEHAPRPPPPQVVFPTEALALCEMFPEVEPDEVLRVWEKFKPSHVAAVDALQNYSSQSHFTTPTSATTLSGGHVPVFFDEAGASSHAAPHGPAPQASSVTPTWVWGGNKQRALHVGSPKKKHRGTGLIDLQAMFPELDKGVVKSVFAQAHGDASRTASLLMQMQDDLLRPPTKHQVYPMPPEERAESAPSKPRGPRGNVYGGKKQGFKTVKRKQREQQKRDTDRMYNQLRASAAHHSNLRSVYAHQAAVAYGQGDRAMAKEYSQKAKREALLAEEAHKKASHEIFLQRNRAQDHNTIDMHGLHVGESIRVITNFLTLVGQLPPENIPPTLNVIVGLGKHSRGGAKIKPAVEEFLREQQLSYRYPPHNRGLMIVDLSPLIERRHGDMRR